MKIVAIILAAGLVVFSAGLAVNYNAAALGTRKDLEQERYVRMVAEEKLERSGAQIQRLESELSRVEKEMKGVRERLDSAEEANHRLHAQLEETAAAKESLERKIEELKEILMRQTTAAPVAGGGPT